MRQILSNITEDIKDETYAVRDFGIDDIDGDRLAFTEVTARQCLSCAMPMNKPGDFDGGNPENLYCVHCTWEDGALKNYDKVLEDTVRVLMETQNMTPGW